MLDAFRAVRLNCSCVDLGRVGHVGAGDRATVYPRVSATVGNRVRLRALIFVVAQGFGWASLIFYLF